MPDDDDYVNIQCTAGRVSAESRRRRIRDREAGNQISSLETHDFDRERVQVSIILSSTSNRTRSRIALHDKKPETFDHDCVVTVNRNAQVFS